MGWTLGIRLSTFAYRSIRGEMRLMPIQKLLSTCLAGAFVAISCVEAQPPVPVKLTVSDATGIARVREAVCSGVPFARGILSVGQSMQVRIPDGDAIPTQTKVLGTWPDGTVKWLLVQFLADCPANTDCTYYFVPGDSPTPEVPLRIDDRANEIVIDTGPLRLEVPKNDLAVLGSVWLRKDNESRQLLLDGSPIRFVLADGTVHTSSGSKPETITIEETGPVRATVHLVGWLQDDAGHRSYKLDTRLRFYAGQSYLKAELTFICLGQPELHEVKEIAVEFNPKLGEQQRFMLPVDSGVGEGLIAEGRTALLTANADMVCKSGPGGAKAGRLGGSCEQSGHLWNGCSRFLAPGAQGDRAGHRACEVGSLEQPRERTAQAWPHPGENAPRSLRIQRN